MSHNVSIKLIDILRYKRQHESQTEAKFINNYLIPMINKLGIKPEMDGAGNIWARTASKEDAPYLFCAHIDTCHRGEGFTNPIVQDDGIIKVNPDDLTAACLGADDGVGIYCNLKMMEAGVRGTYLFTRGEECGGIGASFIAKNTPHKLDGFLLCVEVDRAGTDEVIISQSYGDCASVEFAADLAEQLGLGHRPSTGGVYTDNAEFGAIIPESVNIAAGYDRQHTLKETVNTIYVEALVKKLVQVEWDKLCIVREPGDYGSFYHGFGGNYRDTYNYPVNNFEQLLEYVESNPYRVAAYLDAIGVDTYEIDSEFEEDYYKLSVGL